MKICSLDENFTLFNEVWFEELAPDYPVVRIKNSYAQASIALHGAHLIDYHQHNEKPVIFTSKAAVFSEGKAIRGGIPICWPWFGAHSDGLSSHGYARTNFWNIIHVSSHEEGTRLIFELPVRGIDGLSATIEFFIGKKLHLALTTNNKGDVSQVFSEALHSYFSVEDSQQALVQGLEGCKYIDTVGKEEIRTQEGSIRFPDEVDRIFYSEADLVIDDCPSSRRIHILKTGSKSSVIWNPGMKKGSSMNDLYKSEINHFICAESANIREQRITLAPGESHTLTLTIFTTS